MGYKVIHAFADLMDSKHKYEVGDAFPRLGLEVSEERLAELSSKNNMARRVLIEKIKEPVVKTKKKKQGKKKDAD